MFFYLFWECARGRCAEREEEKEGKGEKESQAGCRLSAQIPIQGLNLTNREIMTWAEINCQLLNWLSHPDALRETISWLLNTGFVVRPWSSLMVSFNLYICYLEPELSKLAHSDWGPIEQTNWCRWTGAWKDSIKQSLGPHLGTPGKMPPYSPRTRDLSST